MKRILIVVAVIFTTVASQAQIRLGVKAGANFYEFTGGDAKSFAGDNNSPKFRTGFAGGGLVNMPINHMFSVQAEIFYSMEGSRYALTGGDLVEKFDYINIPVMFQYNASGFYGETGPQLGILVSANESFRGQSADVKSALTDINFSWAVGLGYKMSNGFGFGARYNIGLVNLVNEGDSKPNLKTSGFHIGVFYLVSRGKK